MVSSQSTQVSLKRVSWDDVVEDHMQYCVGAPCEYYRDGVASGQFVVLGLFYDDAHVGTIIAEIVEGTHGDEMHLLQGVSSNPRYRAYDAGLALAEQLAQKLGCASVHFTATRHGSYRKCQAHGFKVESHNMVKRLYDGR